MQHRDRQSLVAGISSLAQQVYESVAPNQQEEAMTQRLNPLLDAFLLESQPIEAVEATVLIADIRGFTSLTESQPPETIIRLLNRYFARMVQLVHHHGGVVDKFMGDAVMALFGAPLRRDDHLQCALSCAVEMQQAMLELNRESQIIGEPSIYAGIAVNSGSVMAGSFGSRVYNEYTVIGDTVNLTARMEGYSLRGQVLLSDASYASARDYIDIGSANSLFVKGKVREITLYELLAVNAPRRLTVPQVEVRRSPRVLVDFPIAFRRVESKCILEQRFMGKANDLSYFGMNADLPLILPPYSEVILTFVPEFGADPATEVYARVLRTHPSEGLHRTNLEFTTIDSPGHRLVKRYVDQLLWRR
ncbi:adenylate/guanylate cyclase domain-containing protein [Thiocapsa marina]|uniref:Adenylate/guanylate cyclase n=1 Tax=Thiocapsa marina 5811 TaxID=768671 RepID=F9UFY5_9GAMM|nr:adenylate/guanylate cyclase domain-containing protein [Thiocapsa marina]EGV17009.1 adenylate/guanylate cyclase [Thiocapsa marina 5811]